jgi:pyruvate/2-oxoglutarate dehydrogenase complex dihydrolipoamide dehydrogenase (E3) component
LDTEVTPELLKDARPDVVIVATGAEAFVPDITEENVRLNADTIVLAMGAVSVDRLSAKIKDDIAEVYVIGDTKEPRKALEAVAEGAEVGRRI